MFIAKTKKQTIFIICFSVPRRRDLSLKIQVGPLCNFLGSLQSYLGCAGIHTKIQHPESLISKCRKNLYLLDIYSISWINENNTLDFIFFVVPLLSPVSCGILRFSISYSTRIAYIMQIFGFLHFLYRFN